MMYSICRKLREHEHWFAECWSMLFLLFVGIDGLAMPSIGLLHNACVRGFSSVLPDGLWQALFVATAMLQYIALFKESLLLRGVASFISASLLIWGMLNLLLYGAVWHFSMIAWGFFAAINLYALSRILTGIESKYVGKAL